MKKILLIFGTRPEAIKLAPVIFELKKSEVLEPIVCITGQHKEMLNQVMDFFELKPDYKIEAMTKDQTLFNLTSILLTEIKHVIEKVRPDLVMVQGDTTSSMVGAICSFYSQVKVAHVEAGLRSHNKYSPFPEEMNRKITGQIADIHLAPTKAACENLEKEGILQNNIHLVGNTVVDALLYGMEKVKSLTWEGMLPQVKLSNDANRIILVTGHRRESFGEPFKNICKALATIAETESVEIIYPVHLNPNVKNIVYDMLKGFKNIHLIEPLDYARLIYLMNKSYLVLTDSGGIQEEAPTLKKPVLIMRDVTERMEGVEAGVATLVGTNVDRIVTRTKKLLHPNEE